MCLCCYRRTFESAQICRYQLSNHLHCSTWHYLHLTFASDFLTKHLWKHLLIIWEKFSFENILIWLTVSVWAFNWGYGTILCCLRIWRIAHWPNHVIHFEKLSRVGSFCTFIYEIELLMHYDSFNGLIWVEQRTYNSKIWSNWLPIKPKRTTTINWLQVFPDRLLNKLFLLHFLLLWKINR